MIDIHTHVLPGVDDGAKDLNDSLALLIVAKADGIERLVATPHIQPGRFNNDRTNLTHIFAKLKTAVSNANIDIELGLAAEARLDSELINLIKLRQVPFIGKVESSDCLLLELPHSHVPLGYDKFVRWLLNENIRVLIAHPERNRGIQKDYSYISKLIDLGCEFQLTASSIEGLWGQNAQSLGEKMLLNGHANYIASDAHSIKRRPAILSRAKEKVINLLGEHRAHKLFVANPKLLTESLFLD
ncbi:capsule biosynthesis protein CapC [Pseudoalteromonas shioyasakiensis]|uniref:tyrosine-protein phosphatase n=1 Tax=Pseudoalteromonas shioyasakiensis TaxID=1190813 RepID=UPI00211908C2|nr:CpsB/CapC family capsule biosynthesis tyrosine phosphatase [Pseudoalteromonas shioyasakiensis]MCQ8876518.1 capsule biosynthesis protein CapC [Pseudoalteromonas shioyasakiensis]